MAVRANCALDQSTNDVKSFIIVIMFQCFFMFSVFLGESYLLLPISSLLTCWARSSSVEKLVFKKFGKKNNLSTMNIKNSLMIMSSHNDFPTVILRKPSTYRSIIRCSKFIGPPHKNEYDTLFRQMGKTAYHISKVCILH